jgi:RND family efflux transporter MFP subunit
MVSEAPDLVAQLSTLRRPSSEPSSGGRRWLWGLVLMAVLVVAAGAYGLRDRFLTASVELIPVLSLQPGQEAPLFVATGTVTAPVTDSLAPRTPGRLLRLLVQEGDLVEPGQAVALLDPTDRQLAVSQTRAQVASAAAKVQSAEVAVKAAEVHFARAQRLAKTGAGTDSAAEDASLDLDNAKAQLGVARADLQVSRSQAGLAEANLDDTTLKAPFRGVVIKTLAQPGDFIASGFAQGAGALQLADLASLEVDAEVTEVNLGKLRVGMPVEVRLDALPSVGLAGEVFAIRPNVDPAKATAIAKVRLTALAEGGQSPAAAVPAVEQNAKPVVVKLFPGMNGHINFLAKALDAKALAQPTRIEVASRALARQGEALALFTVDKDGKVVPVPVLVAGSDGDRAILQQGPPPGTLVVAAPGEVRPGEHVQAKQ